MSVPDAPTVALSSFLLCAEAPATSRTAPSEKVTGPRGSFRSGQSLWWTDPVSFSARSMRALETADSPKLTDEVAGVLRDFQAYGPGWDGYNAPPPDKSAVDEAIALVDALPDYVPSPHPELHSEGFPILIFETDAAKIAVELHPEGRIVWYGQHRGAEVEGDEPFGSDAALRAITLIVAPTKALAA